jgi:hypothetical protein
VAPRAMSKRACGNSVAMCVSNGVIHKAPGPTLEEEFGVVHLARGASTLAQLFARFCVERTNLLPEVARLRRS